MAALHRFVCFFLILRFSLGNKTIECLKNVENSFELMDGQCAHISPSVYHFMKRESAISECDKLTGDGFSWHPMKLNTTTKQKVFWEKVKEQGTYDSMSAWLDLVRYEKAGGNPDEATWRDRSKWRWAIDNTTLAESFGNGTNSPIPKNPPVMEFRELGSCMIATFEPEHDRSNGGSGRATRPFQRPAFAASSALISWHANQLHRSRPDRRFRCARRQCIRMLIIRAET